MGKGRGDKSKEECCPSRNSRVNASLKNINIVFSRRVPAYNINPQGDWLVYCQFIPIYMLPVGIM